MTERQEIEQRIRDQDKANNQVFRQVAGAADFSAIQRAHIDTPAVFVIRLNRDAGNNTAINAVVQSVEPTFGVVLVVRNARDARGADSSDELEGYCAQIEGWLLGWKPAGSKRGLEYGGGDLLAFNDDRLFWQEIYSLPGGQIRAT